MKLTIKQLKRREYYLKNRERILESNKNWNKRHYDKILEATKRWQKRNPEKMKLIAKRYYDENPERRKQQYRNSHVRHKEERNAYSREYHKKRRLHYNKVHRNWTKNNKEKARHIDRKQYARRKKAIGSYTLAEWEDIKKKQEYRCAICKKKKKLTVDHIIPLTKEGTNYIDNIQALCKSCNCKKSNKLL